MKEQHMHERCLPEFVIRALAIEVAGGDLRGTSWQKALTNEVLSGLFASDAGVIREHLEACPDCRERLERRLRYIETYREELKSTSVREAAREIINAAINAGAKKNGIVLRYASYPEDESIPLALAAQTSGSISQPLKFYSEEGQIVLKEIEAAPSSAQPRLFVLQSSDMEPLRGASLIFSGKEYDVDEMGRVDFGDAASLIDAESQFVIKLRPN